MTDRATHKQVTVEADPRPGAFIRVSKEQLPALESLLSRSSIGFYVHEHFLSMNGGPYIAWVDLGRRTDLQNLQSLLNAAD